LATEALPPEAPDPALVLVPVPAPVLVLVPVLVADDPAAAVDDAAVDDPPLLLLLPHPTTATAHSTGTAADIHLVQLRIALLDSFPGKRQNRQVRRRTQAALTARESDPAH
jgi:hypothetical protein